MLRPDPHPAVTRRTAAETWFDQVVVLVALLVLMVGFGTVIEGRDWQVTTTLVTVMAAATCAMLRGIGVRLVAPFAVAAQFVAITWIFMPETLKVIVPTGDTFVRLGELAANAQDTIVGERAPVAAGKPIVLLIAASFGLLMIVSDSLLQRAHAAVLIGVLLIAVFITPAMISGDTPSPWIFVLVAGLWLVLLRSRTATTSLAGRTVVPAAVLGAAALIASVGFVAATPDVSAVASSWGKPPPAVFGRGINPILELGQNLRRNSTSQALTYSTTAAEAQYLKVATLRDFTGKTWRPTRPSRLDPLEGQLGIFSEIVVEPVRTTITIKRLRSSMLPVPYPAVGVVEGLEGDWVFQKPGMTLTSSQDDSRGQTYTVPSLDVRPTAEQMRSLNAYAGPLLDSYVQLPEKMPKIIAETAREVTANATNDYDRVVALQTWFRSGGGFRYSETAPVSDDYDGNGVDLIAKFLDVRAGYCVHFASAMAVMARTLDIPARIAVGYAPGSRIGTTDGVNQYEATSDDLHAWVEIYFQGAGWTRFDPTTSVGSATRFAEPARAGSDDPAESPEATQNQQNRGRADRLDSGSASSVVVTKTSSRTAWVTLGGLVALGAVPFGLRTLRRRWRLRHGRQDVAALWRELQDEARDFGIVVSAADTPRGFAGRLSERGQIDAEALEALLTRVELARFARTQTQDGDGLADLAAVVTSIRTGASWRQRLVATLLPRSLAGRPPVLRAAPETVAKQVP